VRTLLLGNSPSGGWQLTHHAQNNPSDAVSNVRFVTIEKRGFARSKKLFRDLFHSRLKRNLQTARSELQIKIINSYLKLTGLITEEMHYSTSESERQDKRGEITNKSKKFLAGTLIAASIAVLIITVSAALIGTFHGGQVTVGSVAGSSAVTYSADNINGPWTTVLAPSSTSVSWYTRLEIATTSFSGPVTITWQLEKETAPSTWTPVSAASTTTAITLSGNAQNVYASADGSSTNNFDWSTVVPGAGSYRVTITVETA
jgi:hypothetical protein